MMKNLLLFLLLTISYTLTSQPPVLCGEYDLLDLEANGGMNPQTGAAWADGDAYRFVFVTDSTTNAVSADINYYNAFVNAVADYSTIPAVRDITWYAIASTSTVDAIDNTQTNIGADDGAFFFVNGSTVFVDEIGEFWNRVSGDPIVRIDRDEDYNIIPVLTPVNANWGRWGATWTGTGTDGTADNGLGTPGTGNSDGPRIGLAKQGDNGINWISRAYESSADSLAYVYAMSEVLHICTKDTYYADFDDDGYPDGAVQFSCDPGDDYKTEMELISTAIDCNPNDETIGGPGAPCDDGDSLTIEDYLNENCECVGGIAIPTLSQWGIIVLMIIMLIIGLVAVRRRSTVLS